MVLITYNLICHVLFLTILAVAGYPLFCKILAEEVQDWRCALSGTILGFTMSGTLIAYVTHFMGIDILFLMIALLISWLFAAFLVAFFKGMEANDRINQKAAEAAWVMLNVD